MFRNLVVDDGLSDPGAKDCRLHKPKSCRCRARLDTLLFLFVNSSLSKMKAQAVRQYPHFLLLLPYSCGEEQ